MLAISRALLMNPRLLIMDEPTEGLAPVIVTHVEETLVRLAAEGDVSILVIEQNIGVATQMSDPVAIMVNGRIHRVIASQTLAGDRELQQRLLGVGRHSHDDTETPASPARNADSPAATAATPSGPIRVYNANPVLPTRWSQDVPAARIEAQARTISRPTLATIDGRRWAMSRRWRPAPRRSRMSSLPARWIPRARNCASCVISSRGQGCAPGWSISRLTAAIRAPMSPPRKWRWRSRPVRPASPPGIAARRSRAMTEAFRAWMGRQQGVIGIISAGGSGGTAIATAGMQVLPVGVPKLMVSTMAAGNVAAYVGATDITMMHSVTDVQGIKPRLPRGCSAMPPRPWPPWRAATTSRCWRPAHPGGPHPEKPLVGLTMFGVTTPCVQQVTQLLGKDWEPLVFHATGVGGRSMEKLVESGLLQGVIDVSTTEICDMMMGGILPATEDRFGAVIRSRMPYVGSVGALDMVNFAAPETVPAHYRHRNLYPHNPQITLMRTTAEENARMGRWIGEKLNQMEGPVRFLLPEGGVSALDAPGHAFWDPAADAALFDAIAATLRVTPNRQLIRLPHHINDPRFRGGARAAFPCFAPGPLARLHWQDLTDAPFFTHRIARTLSRHDCARGSRLSAAVRAPGCLPNARKPAALISS